MQFERICGTDGGDKGMKITQLFKIYWPDNGGGIATVMERIANGMSDCEQEIIVCQNSRHKKSADDSYHGIPVHRCSQLFDFASTPFSISFLKAVKKRTKKSDIVIYHFPYPMVDIAVLLGLYSGKLVVWWHCDFEKYKKLAPFYRPLVEHTLKKADQILVSSEGNIENSAVLRKYKEKCKVIPFCVNDTYLQRGKACAEKPVQKKEEINILFIGRLVWYKGCDILLKAFQKMKHKKCKLVLVGDGPLREELKNQAETLKLENVEFTGMISEEEKMQRIEACDFLVLPSTSKAEAFALVQIEAMAFGKPVINTALPSGVPCVSIDGVTGRTVTPGSVKELADAMDELAGNEELRKQFGINALEMVQKEYTSKVMIQRHKQVFEKLLEEDGK